jgi:G:T/U-mismatch repair DNA glycosylase
MFIHQHPYSPFFPKNATKLIVGTLPPPRFSMGQLFDEDVDFCYGSKYGLLWPILNTIFDLNLSFKNTKQAVDQRKTFLKQHKIGICDIIESCERTKINASDLGMENIVLRDFLFYLEQNKAIETILFLGGNSKNGPEYLFRKLLHSHKMVLKKVPSETQRIHQFKFQDRTINTNTLISPSSAANRSIGADLQYKLQKQQNPKFTTLDFRVSKYRAAFKN